MPPRLRLLETTVFTAVFAFVAPACDGCDGDPMAAEELEEMVVSASATAARVRGLSLPPGGAGFAHDIMSKDELADYLTARFEAVDAQRSLDASQRMLVDLGALGEDVDLLAAYQAAALSQIAGYYDWERKTLYIADWQPRLVQHPVVVHELTHALQDHHFGLARFMQPMQGYEDAQGAAASLIEGDATLTMLEAMLEGQPAASKEMSYAMVVSSAELEVAKIDAPAIIGESLLFPYTGGLGLARAAHARGGWPAVDALFEDLPLSTEQVIHPHKHLDERRDYPQDVRFAVPGPLATAGWRAVTSSVNGELGFRTLFKQYLEPADAVAAAAGWDGDRALLLERTAGGPSLTLIASVWDSEDDATEAEAALRATPTPPVALSRDGARLAGAWGEPVPEAEAAVAGLLAEMSTDEIRRFDTFVQRAAALRDEQAARPAQ